MDYTYLLQQNRDASCVLWQSPTGYIRLSDGPRLFETSIYQGIPKTCGFPSLSIYLYLRRIGSKARYTTALALSHQSRLLPNNMTSTFKSYWNRTWTTINRLTSSSSGMKCLAHYSDALIQTPVPIQETKARRTACTEPRRSFRSMQCCRLPSHGVSKHDACSQVLVRSPLFVERSIISILCRIKGDEFTIPSLLDVAPTSPEAAQFANAAMAIFRLVPADYHRFHWPVDGVVSSDPRDIEGTYYTGQSLPVLFCNIIVNLQVVNPQAVNQIDFDVFTANRRAIMYVDIGTDGNGQQRRAAVIAIGALLVGGIVWTNAAKGTIVKRGDDMGYDLFTMSMPDNLIKAPRYFAYGGSTLIVLFPKDSLKYVWTTSLVILSMNHVDSTMILSSIHKSQ